MGLREGEGVSGLVIPVKGSNPEMVGLPLLTSAYSFMLADVLETRHQKVEHGHRMPWSH
jgi:hypothetical protein